MGTARVSGAGRLALWFGVVVASFGFVLVAASQGRPALVAARLALPPLTSHDKAASPGTAAQLANLASFQRRGTSLVGEVTTREGAVMRLVFDTRTHALIGLRVLEPTAPRRSSSEVASGCIDQSSAAPAPTSTPGLSLSPLPNGAPPAN